MENTIYTICIYFRNIYKIELYIYIKILIENRSLYIIIICFFFILYSTADGVHPQTTHLIDFLIY